MQIQLKLSKDFENCLNEMKVKYGENFEFINGLHDSQLDFSEFIDNFVKKPTLADSSIDPNANANHKDIRTFMTEKAKSEDKLFGLNKIFDTIKKQWGLRTAREWFEQEYSRGFYCNDSTTASYFPYCYAVDLSRLAREGLFFLNNYNNEPPKHLTTYFDDVIEFVSFLSNRQSGAVGLPNVLVWAWYFWQKDCADGYYMKDPEYYLRQQLQKFIYRLNQPFLRIDQSAFTNVSIFDRPYLESLFGGMEFPDGTLAIDHIEDILNCQKVFMDVVSETRETNMFTYPVLTYSLLYKDGEFVDEETARWASKHNIRWSDSNFFVSDNVGVLSNCPLSGDTQILFWDEAAHQFKTDSIRNLYNALTRGTRPGPIEVLRKGERVPCGIISASDVANYEIELANGIKFRTTARHLNRVFDGGDVPTEELSLDDYLPFSAKPFIDPVADENESATLDPKIGQSVGAAAAFLKPEDPINLKTLNEGLKFRHGLIDGLWRSTRNGQHAIWTTSKPFADSVVTILAANGRLPFIKEETTDGTTAYGITWRKPSKEHYEEGVYFCDDDWFWVRVKSVRRVEAVRENSYCLTVLDDNEPLFMLANGVHTHNCRLLSDTQKLDVFINSIGGTALSVGSCRVSTINLVRIAYESGIDKEKYLSILRDRVLLDCKALTSMRHILRRNIEKGLLPNYQDGALEMDKQFCTIGGIGMYEVMDLFGLIDTDELGCKSYSDEAVDFATRILDTINEVKDSFDCDFSFNVEMIPAENCAGVLCTADNLLYEQSKYFIYSNQWIPLTEKCTIQEKCRLGSLFDAKCGGGCIAHINIENRFPSEETAWEMLNYVASQGVIYFAFTTKISVCKHRHAFISEHKCPVCGEPIADTYARVVG